MVLDKTNLKLLYDILEKLLKFNATSPGQNPVPLQEEDIMRVLEIAVDDLRKLSCAIIEFDAPVTICGDTHGQFSDVIRLFDTNGWPPRIRYLFLGDYVDRGKQSIETMILMLILRIRYPADFFILRGNHECPAICRVYGFYEECQRRYSIRVWRQFMTTFSYLPICALVSSKLFCMHGGLSPSLTSFDQLREMKLPFEVPENTSLIADLLWSDPDSTVTGYQPNPRGVSYIFGEDVVRKFCINFDIDLIVRAHQVVENGYEFFADHKLVTVFSAPYYCGEYDNCAAVMIVNEHLLCRIHVADF